ncbi:MAG: M6 family metalloprotease domain-containing protein [Lachnoclostridium sp.]|nr:M6 family metalloprotease domain-containing protein [Lachnoclostridium sp.]
MKNLKPFLSGAALLLTVASAVAMPAKPGWKTFTQPDGSEIQVRTVGDERFHYSLTDENHLVTFDEKGVLNYATVAPDGAIVSTGFQATTAGRRSAAAADFLAANKAEDLVSRAKSVREGAKVFKSPARIPSNMLTTNFPSSGDQPVLVVLVEFQDVKFRMADPRDYYDRMLNEEGFSDDGGTGSARDYFIESSSGKFRPHFDVYRVVTLANPVSYYGGNDLYGNDKRPEEMAIEACRALDAEVDFTKYDCDGDGWIDNVFVIYAGYGEADNYYDHPEVVWPHAWNIYLGAGQTVYLDGKLLDHYACSNEVDQSEAPCGIATTCHEFSHVMGLPDLYTTNDADYHTPLDWSVLDMGCYLNDGRTPPLYSAFERLSMGWIDPIEIKEQTQVMVPNLNDNVAFIVTSSNDNEFFLFENRQQEGWDKYLPGHGMLIWRINFSQSYWNANQVNNFSSQRVDIIEADGPKTSIVTKYPITSSSDTWPGSKNKTMFTSTTNPAFETASGEAINLPITAIKEADGLITFSVNGGTQRIAAPAAPSAENVIARSATINWQPVEGATDYLITLTSDASARRILNHVSTGGKTTWALTDLEPETAHYVSIMAIGSSCVSDESAVTVFTTTTPAFVDNKVKLDEPADITSSSFTARWHAIDQASAYELTVKAMTATTSFSETADYTNSALPDGWSTTTTKKYTIPTSCGEAIPALRFNNIGDYVQTAVKAGKISLLKFWVKAGNSAATNNRVAVHGLDPSGAWVKIKEEILSTTGRVITMPIEGDYHALRIEYVGEQSGSNPISVDDIFISGGDPGTLTTVVDGLNVGNVTSYKVTGLDNSVAYHTYSVTALDGDLRTLPSDDRKVILSDNSGIQTITPDSGIAIKGGEMITITGSDADAIVYNLQGNIVYDGPRRSITLPAGLYIVKVDTTVAKVVVK